MPRVFVLLLLTLSCPTAVALCQTTATRELHPAAQVQVKVPKVAPDWLTGTVVQAQTSAGCLAIRLDHTDTAGRQQYAFLAGVTALRVDRRTNLGVVTVGLPPATGTDWEEWSTEELTAAAARCRRG